MRKRNMLMIVAMVIMLNVLGCMPESAKKTGFLSDYSRLETASSTSLRYIDTRALGRYSSFIVDPVDSRLYGKSREEISAEELKDLTSYMHATIVTELSKNYTIAYRPGPGIARIRVAITNLKKGFAPLNILPSSKLVGSGLGGASMEAELVDSQTGRQVAALVESQLGSRLSLAGITTWGDAKEIMDNWATSLKQRLDDAH